MHVRGATIERVGDWNDVAAATTLHDVGGLVVMPGLVDTHVHVNEPGRTNWEGFETATRAAAAGGVTTLFDMPLNSIPATTSLAGLEAKREAASGKCQVNVGLLGGVIPGNLHELAPLARAGVFAFKAFMVPSGVDEFPCVSESDLRAAMPVLAELGLPLMVHAEHPGFIRPAPASSRGSYDDYLASRPPESEREAIELLLRVAGNTGVHLHIVHLSSESGLEAVRAARHRDARITAETCPHYLAFASSGIPAGATQFKCAPPIRSAADRDALWRGLLEGDIDQIVSDHSPCPPAMKESNGDFFEAWGGIASLQLGLPIVWTAALGRGLTPAHVARWMCEAPARLVGLETRKGSVAAGYDADLVIWDPGGSFVVDPSAMQHRHPVTPYAGQRLRGVVKETFVGGRHAFRDGEFPAPSGALLVP